MDNRGDSVVEYLLLLLGAVFIAAVIIVLLYAVSGMPLRGDSLCESVYRNGYTYEQVNFKNYCAEQKENSVIMHEIIYVDGEWHKAQDYIKATDGYIAKSEIRKLLDDEKVEFSNTTPRLNISRIPDYNTIITGTWKFKELDPRSDQGR